MMTFTLLLLLFWNTSTFSCKNFSCTRYETLLLTEENLRNSSGFKKALIHELHCNFSVYEENTLTSIFKWLVALKRSLPRSKFSSENLSPSSTLSYTIAKKSKRVNLLQKSLRVLKLLRSSNRRHSVRKGVLRNFAKFTGKHLCQSLYFNKGLQLY